MTENLPDKNVGNIEYISKQDAIDALEERKHESWYLHKDLEWRSGVADAEDVIKTLPAADVAPVVHAHWIPQKENHEFKEALMNCSACGYPVSRWTGNTNFCPNCGAKMDGERKE